MKFYINYWKINEIYKRNQYSFFLIKKIITKIIRYKYFIKIDIIIIFNKIRIYLKNEIYIFFIIYFGIYYYKILLFRLLNGLTIWQYYINNILFKYFYKFY